MPLRYDGLCPLIQVFDMPRALRFYRDTLGFAVADSSGDGDDVGWVWLRRDSAELMLNTIYESDQRPPVPDAARTKAHDDTCLYIGCADVDGVYAELTAKGLTLNPPKVAPYGMKQLYLHDPDGYNVCFQWKA